MKERERGGERGRERETVKLKRVRQQRNIKDELQKDKRWK